MCEIINPIYHYCIMDAFKPIVNGLEQEYLPEDNREGFQDYRTPDGQIQMIVLLSELRDSCDSRTPLRLMICIPSSETQ